MIDEVTDALAVDSVSEPILESLSLVLADELYSPSQS
jgi:hypothetical protein